MEMVNINNKLVAHKVIIPLKESIVSNVTLQSIGMLYRKDVLLANLDTLGIILLMNALAANFQGKLLEMTVYAQLLKLFGVKLLKHAHVHPKAMEITVFLAQHPGNGTTKQTHAPVHLQRLNGMELIAYAQQEDMGQIVSNALRQDIGMIKQINAFAIHHLFGMDKIVYAHNHISYIKEDAQTAQQVMNGKRTDVKNVDVSINNSIS